MTNVPRVLLVEDDPAIARSVIYALERDGMHVTHCLLLADARRQLNLDTPDLLLLDIGLPDGNGLTLCREQRQSGALPILILSAQGDEIDKVLGLELGADDYVAKPFSPRELVARVRGLLRRAAMVGRPAAGAEAALFHVDRAGQRIRLGGQPLDLTRLEFGLLLDLLDHADQIRSREALLDAVWGPDSDSTDRTVDTHIKTLRVKLQNARPGQDLIVTHRGMGYSLRTTG